MGWLKIFVYYCRGGGGSRSAPTSTRSLRGTLPLYVQNSEKINTRYTPTLALRRTQRHGLCGSGTRSILLDSQGLTASHPPASPKEVTHKPRDHQQGSVPAGHVCYRDKKVWTHSARSNGESGRRRRRIVCLPLVGTRTSAPLSPAFHLASEEPEREKR